MTKSVKVLITGSVLLGAGGLSGVASSVIGMVHTFNTLGTAPAGQATTNQLASQISTTMYAAAFCFLVAFVGLCLAIGGAIAYSSGKRVAGADPS